MSISFKEFSLSLLLGYGSIAGIVLIAIYFSKLRKFYMWLIFDIVNKNWFFKKINKYSTSIKKILFFLIILSIIYYIDKNNYWDKLNKYSPLISGLATTAAVLAALYLGVWKEIIEKPILKVYFEKGEKYPYYHKLAFGRYKKSIEFVDQILFVYRPGINIRFMVFNDGETSAKNVQTKLEKIEFIKDKKVIHTRHYHPTVIKWSGERSYDPVDIPPKSFFFLDIFRVINETEEETLSFNMIKYKYFRIPISEDILREVIKSRIPLSGQIFWSVWIDLTYERGVPSKYDEQGNFILYFNISADNCHPKKFEVIINWEKENWDKPDIEILPKRIIKKVVYENEKKT